MQQQGKPFSVLQFYEHLISCLVKLGISDRRNMKFIQDQHVTFSLFVLAEFAFPKTTATLTFL